MAITYVGKGTSSAVGTPTIPTHQADDLLLLVCESVPEGVQAPGTPAKLPDPSGWTHLGFDYSDNTNGIPYHTQIDVWYRIAADDSTPNPTITGYIDHALSSVVVYRGVSTTAPFEGDAATDKVTGTTTSHDADMTSLSSITADPVALLFVAIGDDNGYISGGTVANAALDSITSSGDFASSRNQLGSTTYGYDGIIYLLEGRAATPANGGTWSWSTTAAEESASLGVFLRDAESPVPSGGSAQDTVASRGQVLLTG